MDWLTENKDWLFSGLGVVVVTYLLNLFSSRQKNGTTDSPGTDQNSISIKKTLDDYKNTTRIIFIDDDVRFKVAKILSKSGWVHTKTIKDVGSLDDEAVAKADILFVDIQGVGVSLGFNDEGLGLASAIKEKYPSKKVVIYSAETKGDRFHRALRIADSSLPKNADPYEFQQLVEEYTIGKAN